jgi:autotransporter-associated beta strand protein
MVGTDKSGKSSKRLSRVNAIWAVAAAAAMAAPVFHSSVAVAATDTWTGASDLNWNNAGNWNPAAVPGTGDSLVFNTAAGGTLNDNISGGLSINSLAFNAPAGTFTLTGNAITLSNTATGTASGGSIVSAATSAEILDLNITMAAGIHAITTGTSGLTFGTAGTPIVVTRNTGATMQFTNGGGGINVVNAGGAGSAFVNDASNGGGILGGWATIGNDWATISGGNIVAYTGYTAITTGAITSNAASNLKYGTTSTGNLTAATGTLVNTILDAHTDANNRTLTITGTMKLGSKGGIFRSSAASNNFTVNGGTLTANGGGELTFSDGAFTATANNLTIGTTVVANDGANPVAVDVVGYIAMNAANTYSGGTFIDQGRVQAGNAASFGTGTVTVLPGGEAFLNATGPFTNSFVISGNGTTETSGGQNLGAIRFGGGTDSASGQITLNGNARISAGSAGTNTMSGKITGTGQLELTSSTGNNTAFILSNTANDWSGGLELTAGGATRQVYLKLGNSEVIPDGAGKGNVTLNGSSDIVRLDLNSNSETINGLIGASSTNNQVANFGTTGASTLTLGNNNATASFGGTISDSGGTNTLSIVKTGTGVQTFGGANTYTGTTTVNGGVLSITGSLGASSAVTVSGGTLSGTGTISGAVTLSNTAGSTIDAGATGPGSIGTLNVPGGVTINGGNLGFDLGATAASTDLLAGGTINFAGASTLTPSGGTPGTSYTIMTGTMTGTTLPTLIEPTTTRVAYNYDPSSYNGSNGATSIILDVVGQVGNLTWNNSGLTGDGHTWDVQVNSNWSSTAPAGNPNQFYQGDNVNFTDSNNGNYGVTISGTVQPGTVTVNTAGAYTFSGTGAIGGSASLSMQGSGSLTITNANTYTGGTTLNSGTLNINNAAALGTGTLTINGGTIDNTSAAAITISSVTPQTWAGSFAFTGTKNLNTGSGAVTLTTTPTVTVTNAAGTLTIPGVIGGSGQGITKAGSGTLLLSATNTFTGAVTVNAGTLTLAGPNAGNSTLSSASGLTINNGGTVNFTVDNAIAGTNANGIPITINTGGVLTQSGGNSAHLHGVLTLAGGTLASGTPSGTGTTFGTFNIDNSVVAGGISNTSVISAQNVTLTATNGAIFNIASGATNGIDLDVTGTLVHLTHGDTGLIKNGNGVMRVNGGNSFTSPVTLNAGTLTTASLANGGVNSGIGASTNVATNLVLSGGLLQYTGATASTDHLFTLGANGGTIDASGTGPLTFSNTGSISGIGSSTLTLTGSNTAANTMTPVITDGTGPNSLTKTGSGTWVLAGANTYTGATSVNQGRLIVSGSTAAGSAVGVSGGALSGTGTINGSVTINSGAIDPGATGPASIGTLNVPGGLTVNGGALNFDLDTTTTNGDQINGSGGGTVNFAAASTLTPTGGMVGSAYTLITSTGMTGTAIPTLVQPTTARLTYAYDAASYDPTNNPTGTSLIVDVSGQVGMLTWNNFGLSGDGQTWDVVGNSNWSSAATIGDPNKFYQGDNVTFNDVNNATPGGTNPNAYNVTLSGTLMPSAVTVNTAGAYTFGGSGTIAGLGTLTKQGNGSLTITTSNSYSGGTTVSAGTLNANNASALGSGAVNISGGTLNLNSGVSGSNAITLNSGTLAINNASLGSASLIINGGTLDNTSAAAITVASTNAQSWAGSFAFAGTKNLNLGSGAVTLNANPTVTISNGTLTVGGVIGNGTGDSFVKDGPGTLSLTADNTFTNGVTVNGGTLQVTRVTAGKTPLGSGNPTINTGGTLVGGNGDAFGFTAGSSPGTINIAGGTVTDLGTASYRVTLQNLSFTGGTLTSAAGNNGDVDGNYSFRGNGTTATINGIASSTTATISAANVSMQVPTTFNIAAGTTPTGIDMVVSSNIIPFGIQPLTKDGTGTLQLSGTNTYTGTTTVINGTLIAASDSALGGGTGGAVAINPAVSTATIDFTSASPAVSSLSSTGAGLSSVVLGNTAGGGSATTLTIGNSGTSTTFIGNISDGTGTSAGAIGNLVKVGGGTLTLQGSNTFTGTTTVSAGTLMTTSSSALAGFNTAGQVTVASGATLAFSLDAGQWPTDLGTAINNANFQTGSILGLNVDTGNSYTFSSAIAGGFTSLIKTGSGSLTVAGANTYAGATNLNNGTLALSGGDNRLPTATTLTVTGSSTLDIGSTKQTVAALTFGDAAPLNSIITGNGGTLTIGAGTALELGPNAPTATVVTTVDMSGLSNLVYNSPTTAFRVGMHAGGNAPGGITNTMATATLSANNTITASVLAVGDQAGARNPGNAILHLGTTNVFNVANVNVGYSGRSGATMDFASGLTSPTAKFRNTDSVSAITTFNIGQIANNGTTVWTDAVDLSAGSIDLLAGSMTIGNADPGTQGTRQGTTNASFTMGAGTATVTTLNVGVIQNPQGGTNSSTAAYVANGTFTMNNPAGVLNVGTLTLATNTFTPSAGGALTVSGTFNQTDGTVVATTIQRGAQTGVATATTAYNWTAGTIQNTSGANLAINNVPLNLSGGSAHTFNVTGANTTTVAATSVISGSGTPISKIGSGTLTLAGANTYSGNTTLSAGTLVAANGTGGSATGSGTVQMASGTLASAAGDGTATTGTVGAIVAGASAHTISPGGNGSLGRLATGDLTVNSNTTLAFDITDSNHLDQILLPSNALSFSGTGTAAVTVPTGLAVGTYVLIDYGSTALTDASNFAITGAPAGYSLSLDPVNTALDLNVVVAGPISSQWALSTGGTWGISGNWTNGIPGNSGDTATFASAPGLTSSDTVTLDGNRTVGHVVFNNGSFSYTIAQGSGGTLTIDNTSGTGSPSITVNAGSHTISAPLALAAGSTVTRDGVGTLTLSGAMSVTNSGTATLAATAGTTNISTDPTSAISLHASNAGTLVNFTPASSGGIQIRHDGLTIDTGAKVALQTLGASNHPNRTLLITDSLSIGGSAGAWTGTLDVGGNDAIIHNGNVTNLTSQIRSGLVGGGTGATLWTGTGVNSSVANADTRGIVAVGMRSQSGAFTSFDGQTLTTGDVALKETFFGDADLNGSVNAADYSMIDNGYSNHLSGWVNGDFNYDGVTNAADYSLIDQSYVFQTTGGPSLPTAPLAAALAATADGGGSASVPEPASVGLLALAASGLLARRRRTNSRSRLD